MHGSFTTLMNADFLTSLKDSEVESFQPIAGNPLGKRMHLYTQSDGFPDLANVNIALIGVEEDRNSNGNTGTGKDLHNVRRYLYRLFPGNWKTSIADLGNITKGDSTSDTYFAVEQVVAGLLKKNILPVIIGGGQDITFSNYRAYDQLEQTVNLVVVDNRFDLGNFEDKLTSESYLGKIITETPSNLFNYCNIGYQTYLNSQEEINLIENLNFDTYRLGEARNLEALEPAFRDADIVSIDIGSVKQSEAPGNSNASPNGLNGEEVCAMARYAGISDKVSSLGIYEFNSICDSNNQTANLIAQIIWHFIEGVNYRANDYPFTTKEYYQKFTVMLEDDDPINFYKSHKTGRWWMEISLIKNNKYKRHALIPCTYKDYLETTKQQIPDRWFRAQRKMI